MKKIISLIIGIGIISSLFAKSDDKILLGAFHKYGITKCDNFILENSKLKMNWNFFISSHNQDISNDVKEVSIIEIFGSKNDTVKVDHSYIESPNGCFLTKRITLSFKGSCESNIDKNYWYISKEMPNKDYIAYSNGKGVERYAKEIEMGNFKSCIQETTLRISSILGK